MTRNVAGNGSPRHELGQRLVPASPGVNVQHHQAGAGQAHPKVVLRVLTQHRIKLGLGLLTHRLTRARRVLRWAPTRPRGTARAVTVDRVVHGKHHQPKPVEPEGRLRFLPLIDHAASPPPVRASRSAASATSRRHADSALFRRVSVSSSLCGSTSRS